jgi:hypothetical protein
VSGGLPQTSKKEISFWRWRWRSLFIFSRGENSARARERPNAMTLTADTSAIALAADTPWTCAEVVVCGNIEYMVGSGFRVQGSGL